MSEKTPVEEFLEANGAAYERVEFPWTMEDEVARLKAEELAIDTSTIFKTLVLKGNKTGPVIALVPLDARLDYKKTAKATGNRKLGFPPMDYVLEATGYEHGANTPIGIRMQHPDYVQIFDTSVKNHQEILVSAGEIGVSVRVAVDELIVLVKPLVADILTQEEAKA